MLRDKREERLVLEKIGRDVRATTDYLRAPL
jgi:hypothetical protein